jgi:transcription initiation factor TFIIB
MIVQEPCPDCGSRDFFLNKDKGEAVCKKCSFVIDEAMIDFGRDTRSFEEDGGGEMDSRTGAPFDPRIANNLATTIGNREDLSRLPARSRALITRIKKKNSWASSSFEHSLNHAMDTLKLLSARLSLPNIVERESAIIYRRAAERGLTLKRSKDDIVVGAIFVACKLHNLPRSMKEIAKASKADLKILGKTYKLLLRELDIRILPTSPKDYVNKFANMLKLSPKTQTRAVQLIEGIGRKGLLSGLSPLSVAASTLYIATLLEHERRTQKEIALSTGITEATLRARCRRIAKQLGLKYKIR